MQNAHREICSGAPDVLVDATQVLGDCWLLSSLSVLAHFPELVRRVLVTPALSARGVYACRLCRAGEWRVVYVDELLPVRRDGRAAFCQVATALWPALVEKARPRRLMSRRWRTATLQPLANAGVRKDFWVL